MADPVLTVYTDTREQRPFEFPSKHQGHHIHTEAKKLKTGDYIPRGFSKPQGGISVERKSFSDFLSCMQDEGLARFEQQLGRLEKWTRSIVVIEGCILDCEVGYYSTLGWQPETLVNKVAELNAMFTVPFMFAVRREWATLFTLDFIFHSMDAIKNRNT